MRTLMCLCAAMLCLLAIAPAATAKPLDGVYAGQTAAGTPVRFLVWGGGTRVGDFSFGRLPTPCGGWDAYVPYDSRVRGARFSAEGEAPTGSERVSATGRFLSRSRASGTFGYSSRVDGCSTQARWTARRVPTLVTARRLEAGPVLAGPGAAWAEGPGSPQLGPRTRQLRPKRGRRWTVRVGGGRLAGRWRRARTVFSTPLASEPFAGLSGSSEALAFRAGSRAYAGPASGRRPYRRLPGAVIPAVDGTLALYERPGTGGAPAEIRTQSVEAGPGSQETTVARHTLSGIEGLRLAGAWAAVAGERIYVLPRAASAPPLLDEVGVPAGVAYAVAAPGNGGFDLASDGKLAVTRPITRRDCAGCSFSIEWYSPSETSPHALEVGPIGRPNVKIERDRIAYVANKYGHAAIRVATFDGRDQTVAVFSLSRGVRHELVGDFDFDGERLTFASRTSRRVRGRWRRGRVRIEVVGVAPTLANPLPTGP